MTNEEARKTVLPALKHHGREALIAADHSDIETGTGSVTLPCAPTLGDYDEVIARFGQEVADALFYR